MHHAPRTMHHEPRRLTCERLSVCTATNCKAVIVLHLDKDHSEEGKQDHEAFGEGDGWREGQLRSGLVETIEMPLNRRTLINFNAEKQPGKG